ncbi:MAG: VOC family protein [Thermaerobacter sp.]|nr:VOC family protein [Thermaerobacter sp.]
MRILHTRIRVRDLERSVAFYRDVLGLEESGRSDSPMGNKLAYLRDTASGYEIELCFQPHNRPFEFPEDIFHIAFEVSDLTATGDELQKRGIPFTDGPHVSANGSALAFIDDPDGYEIELLQRARP